MGSLDTMSPIALRARLRRWRRHGAAIALLFTILCAVAVHHAAPTLGEEHHAADLATVAQMRLGVFAAVGAAVAAVAFGLLALGRWRPVAPASGVSSPARPPEPRVRAGPAMLVLLCVRRC